MNEAQAAEQIMRESIDRADPEVLGRYCRVTAMNNRRALEAWEFTCIHHNDAERASIRCPVCLLRENAELRKDKARLDWITQNWHLIRHPDPQCAIFPDSNSCYDPRAAIDAQMEK